MAFTTNNTDGYTQAEINEFNEELTARLDALGVEPDTEDAEMVYKALSDEIARR